MMPLVIDAFDFARNARSLHGKIPLSALERLQDYLTDTLGSLLYAVGGDQDEEGKLVLQIQIHGAVNLKCQRCLEMLVHVLDINTRLLLAQDEGELSRFDEDASVDSVLARHDLDFLALIEDEIILNLPLSPRHREEECMIASGQDSYADERTPFAALAALKKPH